MLKGEEMNRFFFSLIFFIANYIMKLIIITYHKILIFFFSYKLQDCSIEMSNLMYRLSML
jgi:hypothetical protein